MNINRLHAMLSIFIFFQFIFINCSTVAIEKPQNGIAPELDRLCAEWSAPDSAPDKININCQLDEAAFSPDEQTAPKHAIREFKVVAYNLERGHNVDGQILALKNNPDTKDADVILLSEADRGCERTGKKHIARDIAKALEMNMVYGVEFMELPEDGDYSKVCEHGNAVMSRFPIVNKSLIRFKETDTWYDPPGNGKLSGTGRLGGRMAVQADLDMGWKILRVYSVHLESSATGNKSRGDEATEVAYNARFFDGPVIIGGDMNSGLYLTDLITNASRDFAPKNLKKRGYTDAHEKLQPSDRATCFSEGIPMTLDLIFSKDATAIDSRVGDSETFEKLSDHLPVWAKFVVSE